MTNTSNYNLKKYDLNDEVTDTILGLSENMDTLDTELKRLNDKSIVKIVASLPIIGESNALYLVPKADGQTSDIYDEYIWTGSGWEWITTKQLDIEVSGGAFIAIYGTTTYAQIQNAISEGNVVLLDYGGTHRLQLTYTSAEQFNFAGFVDAGNTLFNAVCTSSNQWSLLSNNFTSSNNVVNGFWAGTQAQYDALGTYDGTTLYLIKEG